MKTLTIEFSKTFTRCPGGRFRHQGEFSGEAFREDVLKPALRECDVVTLNLDGAIGFPSSFIDEAFGGLVDDLGYETVTRKLQLVLNDDAVTLREIQSCLKEHRRIAQG